MAGCTFCQIGVNGNWQSSSEWKRGCEGWVIDGLGFEEDVVDLPPFVWFDWNGVFPLLRSLVRFLHG